MKSTAYIFCYTLYYRSTWSLLCGKWRKISTSKCIWLLHSNLLQLPSEIYIFLLVNTWHGNHFHILRGSMLGESWRKFLTICQYSKRPRVWMSNNFGNLVYVYGVRPYHIPCGTCSGVHSKLCFIIPWKTLLPPTRCHWSSKDRVTGILHSTSRRSQLSRENRIVNRRPVIILFNYI